MNSYLEKIEKKLIWIYPILALVLYWPTRNAGFVHDFTGWYERYQEHGWSGITHCFGYHRLQHVMHFFHFLIYKAFDVSPIPWYIIYSILFGLNAYLVFKLTQTISDHFKSNNRYLPLIASFLFLIHPYQTTAVVWKVCFHYLLGTFLMLSALIFIFRWLQNPNRRTLAYVFICYILSLFTHEFGISLSLITLVLVGHLFLSDHELAKKAALNILLPLLIILPIYFSLTPHLLQELKRAPVLSEHTIDVRKQSAGILEYGSKHALFTRYWSHPSKEQWKQKLFTWPYIISICGVMFALLLITLLKYKHISSNAKIGWFALLAFVAAIAPFTSAYIYYVQYAKNDMYGFSASAFIIISLVAFSQCLPKRISQVLLVLYGSLSLIFLLRTNYYWHESAQVTNSLLEDFRWYDKKKVYVLLGPDNFKGTLMLGSKSGFLLKDHLFVKNKTYPTCDIESLMEFNMAKRTDGVSVQVHTTDSLSVKLNQWGTWFWRDGLGASSYETDKFKVNISLPYYRLKRKAKEEDAVFIYQDGDKWKEVEGW